MRRDNFHQIRQLTALSSLISHVSRDGEFISSLDNLCRSFPIFVVSDLNLSFHFNSVALVPSGYSLAKGASPVPFRSPQRELSFCSPDWPTSALSASHRIPEFPHRRAAPALWSSAQPSSALIQQLHALPVLGLLFTHHTDSSNPAQAEIPLTPMNKASINGTILFAGKISNFLNIHSKTGED